MSTQETTGPVREPLPPEVAREIDSIAAEIERFRRGELSPERFRAFRLGYGIYGQRQPGVQMIRVRIPGGIVSGRQLEALAAIAEDFSTGVAHLTTRQDVQFHFVALERVPALLARLARAGLTTREACGNSVRNVTACPMAGSLAEELFDVRPYALAVSGFLLRNPFCQQLARKFKIALSACPEDCAATGIHDIGATGRIVGDNGRTRYGFRVVVGGGLGSTPFTAQVLSEFVPAADLLPTVKAILKVFAGRGNRLNKMKARLKFVVHRLGIEEFRRLVGEAAAGLSAAEREEADLLRYVPEADAPAVAAHLTGTPPLGEIEAARALERGRPALWGLPPDGGDAFARWASCSLRRHRDPGRALVTVLVPLGDLTAAQLRALAACVAAHAGDRARIAIDQNIVLPSVERVRLRVLHAGLAEAGLAEAGAGTALDVTCCPGADTCGIGITSSKGLTRAIRRELLPVAGNGGLDALRGVTIKVSGCPNACGQHHVAGLGLHGVVRNVGGRPVPSYQLHLGGRAGRTADGEARIGRALEKIPARRVPGAVAALLGLYARHRSGAAPGSAVEPFEEFVAGLPRETVSDLLGPFREDPHADEPVLDWDQRETFSTDGIGAGECAGAGTDAETGPFDNARAELLQASLFMDREQWVDALANLNRFQYTLARVLLGRLGRRPESDYETACELRARVIDRGYAGESWNENHGEIERLLGARTPEPDAVRAAYGRALGLVEEGIRTLAALEGRRSAAEADVPG